MARPLRQNTAITITMGPFQDPSTGAPLNALTITQADVRVRKAGTAWAQKNDATSAAFEENGHYSLVLSTTDSNTLGPMRVAVLESGALIAWEDFEVLHATVYDAWFSTGITSANLTQWLGSAPNALVSSRVDASVGAMATDVLTNTALAASAVTEIQTGLATSAAQTTLQTDIDDLQTRMADTLLAAGTSDSGTTTTMVDAARTEADTDYWKGNFILFTSGTIAGQCRLITGFTPGTDTITFSPATTQAVSTQTYEILPAARVDLASWLGTAAPALVGGRLDAHVGSIANAVLTATAFAAGAFDAVWSVTARLLTAGTNIVLAKGTGLTGLNDLSTAQVNSEVDTALADARLDELLVADSDIDGAAPPTVGSVFHELLSKTAGSFTYDQTTDSLEAIRDRGDVAWITGAGGDPWATAVPGAYGAGTAGNIIGNNLNATVSSRATPAQVNTEVDTALSDINLDHLVGTSSGIPAVPAGTYLDQIMDNGTASYDRNIHSLQAAIDNSADMADFGILLNTTVASLTSQTVFTLSGGAANNDAYTNQVISFSDVSVPGDSSTRRVADYVGSTRTVTLDSAPDFTLVAGDQVRIFAAQSISMEELVGPRATVVANGANTATTFQVDIPTVSEAAADWWKDAFFSFDLNAALAGQTKRIQNFNQSTGMITMASAFTAIPTAGNTARLVTR